MFRILSIVLTLCIASLSLNAKTLVVYYSYTNTVEQIVNSLKNQITCDVVEIEPAEKGLDYAANGYAIGSALIAAIRNHPDDPSSYPAIDPVDINLDEYDTIIIGAPLWWSQMAAPLQTYLFHNGDKMAGKKIGVIVSSHSSGISGVVADAKRLIPDGDFLEPSLWIRSTEIENCNSMIAQWLREINYEDISASIRDINSDYQFSYNVVGRDLYLNGTYNLVSIFDRSGVKIAETNKSKMNISSLTPDLYILAINSNSGIKTYKIKLN